MDVNRIVSELDTEIARLQQIRTALTGLESVTAAKKPGRGRPKGSKNVAKTAKTTATKTAATKATATKTAAKKSRKRNLSPEGRKRIAEAMKRRWAEHRKEASK